MPVVYLNTFVTRLTAESPAAIGVVRIWGGDAVAAADSLFVPRIKSRPLSVTLPGQPRLGTFAGDEVVAIVFEDDHADLGFEVEIQCHGSPLVISKIVCELAEKGVIEASAEAFQKAHGTLWLERLAMQHLGQATAPNAVALLWRQRQGALRRRLQMILHYLEQNQIEISIDKINQLIVTSTWATRLSKGFRVALAGSPNVGKSSLANALAGYERMVVSPIPGTTRDLVVVYLNIGGWPIILTDTAGLRDESADPLEIAGISMARQEHQLADLVLNLTEATKIQSMQLGINKKLIQILTKSDLVDSQLLHLPPGMIALSAKIGTGLEELMKSIINNLVPIEFQNVMDSEKAILFDSVLDMELKLILNQIQQNNIQNASENLRRLLLK